MQRDYVILQELERWRFCLGRHLRVLAEFDGVRACDRRLKKLIEMGYIDRKKILYGIPSLYTLTYKGKQLIGATLRKEKIKVEQITHDISVLDTGIYFMRTKDIKREHIITEKDLHKSDGFGVRRHQPDFSFVANEKTYCVEVELTLKSVKRLKNNIEDNFKKYDCQIWVIPKTENKIKSVTKSSMEQYTGIEILDFEDVKKYVDEL